MMTAIANSTKEVVVAKGANGRDEFSCPDCCQPVYPRRRAKWTDHFVHKPNSACKTKLVASLESDEHKLGKKLIVDWLKKNRDSSVEIVTEKIVTTVDGRCRKIDVAVIKNDLVIEAHECQLSPICVDTKGDGLLDRTVDYHSLNICVTWWMGEKATSLRTLEFFESIKPGLSKKGKESIINEPFHLWAYPVYYPNMAIFEIAKNRDKTIMKNTKQKNCVGFNDNTSLIFSRAIGRFLNGTRSQMTKEEQLKQDEVVLQLFKDYIDCDFENLAHAKKEILSIVVQSYTETAFGFHELDEAVVSQGADSRGFELTELIRDYVLEFASSCIPEKVFQFAAPCFDVFNLLKSVDSTDSILLIRDTKENVFNSLFKYSNPQTAKAFIKEAIANALDQNPVEATALCAAWEQIQPTLEKDIETAPLWVKQVTKETPPLSVNGNGRH